VDLGLDQARVLPRPAGKLGVRAGVDDAAVVDQSDAVGHIAASLSEYLRTLALSRIVLDNVESRMRTAFADVHERAEREQVSLRDAAHLVAVERVAHACRERGWV
jgi:hypothetical protein